MRNYQRHSIRLKDYDYSQAGAYFITILSFGRKQIFGTISNNEIKLNQIGLMVEEKWKQIAVWFPNVELGEYVIMPNHLHGVILIQETINKAHGYNTTIAQPTVEKFGQPVPGSIPTMIRTYKSVTTQTYKKINKGKIDALWHRNYYEHIIRNEQDYSHICEYILGNPAGWESDEAYFPS